METYVCGTFARPKGKQRKNIISPKWWPVGRYHIRCWILTPLLRMSLTYCSVVSSGDDEEEALGEDVGQSLWGSPTLLQAANLSLFLSYQMAAHENILKINPAHILWQISVK